MTPLLINLQQRLEKRRQQGNLRQLKVTSSTRIDFASNDYLGFLHHGLLHALVEEESNRLISKNKAYGASGSRLLTGHSLYYDELEQEIACFHAAETGLIFNSGYLANLGLVSALARPEDTVIYDTGIHASLYDALKLTKVQKLPFRHQDLEHLTNRLKKAQGIIFVCVESIYSVDGSSAPLEKIYQLCQEKHAYLIVDEAHATGWTGEKGEGRVQMLGLQSQVFARVHTFSKALGVQGAIVLGSPVLREYLINFARPLIYTTALPLHSLVTIRCAYHALQLFPEYPCQLQTHIAYFRQKIKERPLPFVNSDSPIQCLKIAGNQATTQRANQLQKQGFDVRPLLSPTVRRGEECVRICLHAFNTREEIDALLQALHQTQSNQGT